MENFHAIYMYAILNLHSSVINKKLFIISIKYNSSFVENQIKTKQNPNPNQSVDCAVVILVCSSFGKNFRRTAIWNIRRPLPFYRTAVQRGWS